MAGGSGARWGALAALLRPDAARWFGLGLLITTASAAALSGPLVVRRIVDEATDGTTAAAITRLALIYLALALATQALNVVVAWYATVAAWHTTNQMRLDMADHVLHLDHEFHRRHTPGELIQRVDGDVTSVSDFLGKVVPRALGAALLIGGMLVVLAVLDWRVAIGMAIYVGLSVLVVVRSRHRAVHESSDEMGSTARLYGGIEERLNASVDLRANGAADHVAWRFVEDSADVLASGVRREKAFLVMWWYTHAMSTIGKVVVLVGGAILVSRDLITIGTAFLLFQYLLLVSRPLEDVINELETVQKANGAMVRVLALLEVRSTIRDDGDRAVPPGALSVRFESVDFDYADRGDDELAERERSTRTLVTDGPVDDVDGPTTEASMSQIDAAPQVLRDVDLTIAAGRSVGIVGRTGSGKTTFSRLVLRLVEPTRGRIEIGGVPIDSIPLAELRRRVALVPQEVELFAGTVRDNVTLFDDQPTDAQVIEALEQAGLDSLAAAGIHRPLGAGGAGLSAGEAQLLSLARVWLRNPDLVVLDEATARVDPDTERRLESAIRVLINGRTTLVIAHRLSTLRAVDDIVMFDAGRVVEAGARAALAADPDSRYRRLLELALDQDTAVDAVLDGVIDSTAGAGS